MEYGWCSGHFEWVSYSTIDNVTERHHEEGLPCICECKHYCIWCCCILENREWRQQSENKTLNSEVHSGSNSDDFTSKTSSRSPKRIKVWRSLVLDELDGLVLSQFVGLSPNLKNQSCLSATESKRFKRYPLLACGITVQDIPTLLTCSPKESLPDLWKKAACGGKV